ncbi:MAG: lipoyl(octanoyl) transferase LipB [Deltaproteobacteria bacterium]|nr:lipoyl(octanoyl) transferase LipB [Deltaproteobacteria bacterium]
MRPFTPVWLGTVPYAEAFALQKEVHAARVAGEIEDALLLLEHPPTITHSLTGRGSENVVASAETLALRGVTIEGTDRGGNVTFHGPGQLVGYPIISIAQDGERDLHRYLRNVEEVLLRTAGAFDVRTERVKGRTGTWFLKGDRDEKLAAIGVKCSRWVTLHGFAMNVLTDLSFFDLIVPCGIDDAGVVSLERIAQGRGLAPPTMESVVAVTAQAFGDVFARHASPASDRLRTLCAARGIGIEPVAHQD